MPIYHFTIQHLDGSGREETGRMALRDSNAARAFGNAVIHDIMTGDAARYANWTMDISKSGRREVCRLAFDGGTAASAGVPPIPSAGSI
jgi:hypothetical protein